MHDSGEKKYKRIESELLCTDETDGTDSWRIFKIMAEFVAGFELLRRYGLAATFFGTSRCKAGDKVYADTQELASRLAKTGYTIITGGGGGAMEAANRGAYDAKGNSVGINIVLPAEQTLNQYTTDSANFNYFFTRKVMLAFASEVYIFMPGGFGTLDEFFEIITLVQTRKIRSIPVVLVDRSYWEPLLSWIRDDVYGHYQAIDREDMDIYHVVDSVDEAYNLIERLVRHKDVRSL